MRGFLSALAFLTRLPVPVPPAARGDEGAGLERSVAFFPLVGGVIGGLLVAAAALLDRLPAAPGSAVILALWVGVTGGLHVDGLIDTVDGLSGARERERSLAIMRDSHVGALGVVAAIVTLLWKFAFVTAVWQQPLVRSAPALLLPPIWSRWSMAAAITCFPYARQNGLGRAFRVAGPEGGTGRHGGGSSRRTALGVATALAVGVTLVVGLLTGEPPWVLAAPAVAALAALLVLGRDWTRRLGGLTGDTYGALNEIAEALALAAVVLAAA